MELFYYISFCLLILRSCDAYRILVVYPAPSKSHSILGDGIVRHLLNDGHEVTYISAFEYKNPPPNLRVIDVSSNSKAFPAEALSINRIMGPEGNRKFHIEHHMKKLWMTKIASLTAQHENVQKLLSDVNEQFDVVLVEWIATEALSGLAAVYNCPLIWISPVEVNSAIIQLIDAAPNPAYSADNLSESVPPFSFFERVEELWMRLKVKMINLVLCDAMEAKVYDRDIAPFIKQRGREPPSYFDIRFNASLILGNSHVSIGLGMPIPQNYIPVGGYHIVEEAQPLPEDLKKIMDNAKAGVIYFSMGSNLKSKEWPENIKRDLLNMFGGLKQTVLWKFEGELTDVPKNVHILQWAPQSSILSHSNCILFISHGGLLSTTETIHYGVPLIGIPVFGDQFSNVKRAVHKGFAAKVDLTYNLANELKPVIEEMISNPKYKERVKELSFIYHDRPVKPGVEVAHWVKHVIRTQGAPHLRSPGFDVPLYQQLYLDLAVVLTVVLIVVFILMKRVCVLVCMKKKSSEDKKND